MATERLLREEEVAGPADGMLGALSLLERLRVSCYRKASAPRRPARRARSPQRHRRPHSRARRVLSFITDRYLFTTRHQWVLAASLIAAPTRAPHARSAPQGASSRIRTSGLLLKSQPPPGPMFCPILRSSGEDVSHAPAKIAGQGDQRRNHPSCLTARGPDAAPKALTPTMLDTGTYTLDALERVTRLAIKRLGLAVADQLV